MVDNRADFDYNTCMNAADLLVRGLALPPLPMPPEPLPAPGHCVLTGVPITSGYPVAAITTDATNEFLDTFRGHPTGYVSETAARAISVLPPAGIG